MTKLGSETAWAVINDQGHIWVWTIAMRRKDALRRLSETLPNQVREQPARWLRKNGCKCRRVFITEIAGFDDQ